MMPDASSSNAEEVVEGEVVPSPEEVEAGTVSAVERRIASVSQFSGPLPSPKHLREYDEVQPGLAKTIVEQWTRETEHRHKTIDRLGETDNEAMKRFYRGETRGQYLGFILFAGVLGVAAYAIFAGYQLLGLAGILASTAPVIWSMRRSSKGESPPAPVDLAKGDEVETIPPKSKD